MIGKQILHYKIVEKLGEGGMGVVYRAEDTKLHRDVALKFLPDEALANPEDRARFVAEARSAAALDHPNICTVYEINETDGHHFIAMAYIDGRNVKDIVEGEGPMPVLDALRVAVQIAEGLSAAHEQGIVHRDIKSANVMVTPRGRAKIMDFGLAQRRHGERSGAQTTTGGTAAYAPPELARGDAVDHRGDVWSFGVTLYEMVTGHLPFRGDYESAITYSILNEAPASPSSLRADLPEALDRIILRALAKKPEDRYQSAEAMRDELDELRHAIDPTVSRAAVVGAAGAGSAWKRVVIAAGVYLGAAWVVVRALGFIVARAQLSPHLVSMAAFALVSLLPAVVLVAHFTGRRGSKRWGRPEWVGVPANAVVTGVLLALVFADKDLGAAMKRVEVTNEEGETIERAVPKGAFRKNFSLYAFENHTGDPDLDWLQYGMPLLLEFDLYQDVFLTARSAFDPSAYQRLEESGFKDWAGAPLALKRKVADEFHETQFVTGAVGKEGSDYVVTVSVHETRSGKLLDERTYRGTNVFEMTDEIANDIKHAVDVPGWYLDGAKDVPVADMVTGSERALRELALGVKSIVFDDDWAAANIHLEAATDADSTLAFAHFQKFIAYRVVNNFTGSMQALDAAMRHAYKVPERFQFIIKGNYYYAKEEPDKALALFKMMAELYPDDIQGFQALAQIHVYRNELDDAIAAYERIVQLDPYQDEHLHSLGELYSRKGNYEKAIEYDRRYADLNPEDPTSFQKLAEVFAEMGEFVEARKNYEKALLIEPQRVSLLVGAGEVERRLGEFDAAFDRYRDALAASHSSADSMRAYNAIEECYEMRGEFRKAIETMQKRYAKTSSPFVRHLTQLDDVDRYVYSGRTAAAFETMEEIKRVIDAPPMSRAIPYGYVQIYTALEEPDSLERAVGGFEEYIDALKLEVLREEAEYARALVHELRAEYDEAIAVYSRIVAKSPSAAIAYRELGRCYRLLGQHRSAEESLLKSRKLSPYDPHTNYELALLYHDMGNAAKAEEHLERALTVWEHADPEYRAAADARATRAKWESAANM